MKINHVSALRKLTPGQSNQLKYESEAILSLERASWNITVLCDEVTGADYEVRIPKLFRHNLGRKLFFWLWCLQNIPKNEVLLQRYTPADPFLLFFCWLFPNRYLVHHSLEIREIQTVKKGWEQAVLVFLEKLCSRVNSYSVRGHFSASNEIKNYYKDKDNKVRIHQTYLNGIDISRFDVLEDGRQDEVFRAAFIASSFSSWHGLDLLLDDLERSKLDDRFILHIIGKVFKTDLLKIKELQSKGYNIKAHGVLNNSELRSVLSKCDVGLSSFALYRKNMKEASTLKVREYLAGGLPVYSGHIDSGFTAENEIYLKGPPSVSKVCEFIKITKTLSRDFVRDKAKDRMDKKTLVNNLINTISHEG